MMVSAAVALAQTNETLELPEAFFWGVIGALISLLAIQGLPLAHKLATGQLDWKPAPLRCVGVAAFVVFFLALGGGVAILVGGATEAKHAIFYGLGWQGILSGYMRSSRSGPPTAQSAEGASSASSDG